MIRKITQAEYDKLTLEGPRQPVLGSIRKINNKGPYKNKDAEEGCPVGSLIDFIITAEHIDDDGCIQWRVSHIMIEEETK